jgi:hypothetical protein
MNGQYVVNRYVINNVALAHCINVLLSESGFYKGLKPLVERMNIPV